MTAIEFFDRSPIDNVVSLITIKPDKIIFIGETSVMEKTGRIYESFIESRELNTKVEYLPIIKNNLNNIVAVLSDIVEKEDECVFDLTGGEDLVLVAMGIVSQKYKDKNIQMQRLNVNNGVVTDCDCDGKPEILGKPTLTVKENITLHGGKVRYKKNNDDKTFDWDMSEDFVEDLNTMWEMCRDNPGLWNTRLNVLGEADLMGENSKRLKVEYDRFELREEMKRKGDKYISLGNFLKLLVQKNLIYSLVDNGKSVSFTYKNEQVKKCLIKSGTVLELKVLEVANRLKNKKGENYYSDSMNGVYIDWDGKFHEREDVEKDTENEIDVVLMKGLVPLFISCKNGSIDDDELYKLETITNRFGGVYAKKVLIATYLGKKQKNIDYFRQRAKDMKIDLIEGVHLFSEEQLEKTIKNIITI
ncbi:MAG: DUF1887 family protein [Clostridia bacterium]|nr:DUF1887 family protein [Clostridia bacterium]